MFLFFFSPFAVSSYLTMFRFSTPHLHLAAVCSKQMLSLLLIGATATETSTCSFYISKYGGLCLVHSMRCAWREVEPKLFFAQSNFQR